jgi:hypothetical protein
VYSGEVSGPKRCWRDSAHNGTGVNQIWQPWLSVRGTPRIFLGFSQRTRRHGGVPRTLPFALGC